MNKKLVCLFFIIFSICLGGCGTISDGEYTASVVLSGGSGRAYIVSPCEVTVQGGNALARLKWSSPNYDYMIVDGTTYYPVNEAGNSEFEIPVTLGKEMSIQADTTAMSTPHLIEYSLLVSLDENPEGDGKKQESTALLQKNRSELTAPAIDGLTYVSTDENTCAECFKIHRYEEGFVVISVDDGRNYLIVPEGKKAPDSGSAVEKLVVLDGPLDRIYLAASGAMCHFDSLDYIDNILLSGIEEDAWYIDSAKEAMRSGKLIYGGKYSAPDYEQIVMMDIDLAIENTMILHVPKVQEKLEQLGVPVFIDRASYEPQPLGRCEWVKVYGALLGREEAAERAFDEQRTQVEAVNRVNAQGKNVVLFSLNSNHQIVTRSGNDYFAKMIEMAGGEYLQPKEAGEDAASQRTISIEAFYSYASNADILIYNATIESAPESLEKLMDSDVTFKDFKAFKEGNVWYTDKALYQYADKTGNIINDLSKVIADGEEETTFFHKLK